MKRTIKKVAVLGSGIMGSRIACHFANIGIEVLLLDIVPKELNDTEKAKKEREIQEKIIAIQQKTATFQKEIQDMEQNLKTPILERVKNIVDDVAKASGVDFVYEAATAPILYAKSEKDLTDDVIKAYNKKHAK